MPRPTPTIAILDDEAAYRRALSRLLKAHAYHPVEFANGNGLVAEAGRRSFDCALLDLCMPGMSGLDVLTELKRNPRAPPVIIITAHDDPDLMRRARALNAFECWLKPVAASTLLDAIERALRR